MQVTVLAYGGGEIGFQNAPYATVERLLNSALDAGLNVIDTAECYVDSEEKIGNAVAARRDEYFLFTKCGHVDDLQAGGLRSVKGLDHWNPKGMTQTIDRSLQRLQTDRVDLLQLHRDRKSTRLNSSHSSISYAVFCLKKKKKQINLQLLKKKKKKKKTKKKK